MKANIKAKELIKYLKIAVDFDKDIDVIVRVPGFDHSYYEASIIEYICDNGKCKLTVEE